MLKLAYLFILCAVIIVPSLCDEPDEFDVVGFLEQSGIQQLATNKNYLFVGEHLTVECSITDNDVTSENMIYFGLSPLGMKKAVCFNESDVYVIDNKTAVLNISVTPQLAGVYYCFNAPGCHDKDNIGFTNDVFVEYAPRPVTDFSCVVFNWNEKMKCTWRFPVTYVKVDDIKVSVKYSTKHRNIFSPCPHLDKYSCLWKPFAFENSYNITVTVTNKKNNASVENHFLVNPNLYVKPSSLKGLTCTASKKGCLHLNWYQANHSNWTSHYRVQVEIMNDGNRQNESFEILTDTWNNMTYNACTYPAFSLLNISVEAHPAQQLDGFWSTPVYCANYTLQEEPGAGPSITDGSYVIDHSPDTEDYNITFYWNPVDKTQRNGIIDSYLLQSSKGEKKSVSHSDSLSTTLQLSKQRRNLFVVNIYAHNGAGLSQRPSKWHINPSKSEVPHFIQESLAANIENNDLILSWDNGPDSFKKFTIYWCYSPSQIIGNCEKPLEWRNIEGSNFKYKIPPLPHKHKDYSYGLSVQKYNSDESSGIFWTQCLKEHHSYLEQVSFTADPLIDSIRVSWERHDCSYDSGFKVKYYVVKYCVKSDCKDSIRSEQISSSNYTYKIRNATAGTEYQVSMEMFSDADEKSKDGKWKVVIPASGKDIDNIGNTNVKQILIITGAVALFLLIVFPFIQMYCRCRERGKMVKAEMNAACKVGEISRAPSFSPSSSSTDQNYSGDSESTLMTETTGTTTNEFPSYSKIISVENEQSEHNREVIEGAINKGFIPIGYDSNSISEQNSDQSNCSSYQWIGVNESLGQTTSSSNSSTAAEEEMTTKLLSEASFIPQNERLESKTVNYNYVPQNIVQDSCIIVADLPDIRPESTRENNAYVSHNHPQSNYSEEVDLPDERLESTAVNDNYVPQNTVQGNYIQVTNLPDIRPESTRENNAYVLHNHPQSNYSEEVDLPDERLESTAVNDNYVPQNTVQGNYIQVTNLPTIRPDSTRVNNAYVLHNHPQSNYSEEVDLPDERLESTAVNDTQVPHNHPESNDMNSDDLANRNQESTLANIAYVLDNHPLYDSNIEVVNSLNTTTENTTGIHQSRNLFLEQVSDENDFEVATSSREQIFELSNLTRHQYDLNL